MIENSFHKKMIFGQELQFSWQRIIANYSKYTYIEIFVSVLMKERLSVWENSLKKLLINFFCLLCSKFSVRKNEHNVMKYDVKT